MHKWMHEKSPPIYNLFHKYANVHVPCGTCIHMRIHTLLYLCVMHMCAGIGVMMGASALYCGTRLLLLLLLFTSFCGFAAHSLPELSVGCRRRRRRNELGDDTFMRKSTYANVECAYESIPSQQRQRISVYI